MLQRLQQYLVIQFLPTRYWDIVGHTLYFHTSDLCFGSFLRGLEKDLHLLHLQANNPKVKKINCVNFFEEVEQLEAITTKGSWLASVSISNW